MPNITIAIGRNVDGKPMVQHDWDRFRQRTGQAVRYYGGEVHANVTGTSLSETWGTEEAFWLAASISEDGLADLREELAFLAKEFGQDAIAVTTGTTTFVTPEE